MGAESLVIESMWGCGQTLVALLLVVVGAVSVRPADARAGYLLVAGGALVFLNACCGSLPTALMQSGQTTYDTVELLFMVSSWSGLLLRGGAGLASILAAVMLARALLATEKPGGAA